MKKKRLLKTVFLMALLCAVGTLPVSAFTTNELEGQGWTKVTNLTDVSNYYYVFVDAGSSNYAMGRLASSAAKPVYMNLADPLGFAGEVWALSGSGSYTMQNLMDNRYFISGNAGWNDSMADAAGSQGSFSISLANGKYSIKSTTTNQWVGPWNDKGAVASNYEDIAANKSEALAPGFFIYAMSRTDYNSKRITDSWLTSHGWSKVTANSALGNTANYYLIVEKESFGYALARTSSGRPVHKSLSNPFAAPNELWLLTNSGSGYKFQSVVDGTYFTSAAGDWNTSMGNAANADIIATLSNGVYTLSAGGSNNIGHWQDNTQFPYENESVAANKNETNRNSYYIYTISKSDYATQRASNISSLASTATEASPANLTSFVVNNSDFSILAKQGWTTSGTAGNQQTGNGAFETWNSNNVSITQEVADLPGGLYTFKAQMVMGNGSTTANLYVNADQEYTASASQVCTSASYDGMKAELMADPAYAQVTVNPHMSSDGTMTVGLKVPSGWIVFDNFQLLYQGPTIKSNSIAFTSGSAVTADQWYAFDIPVAGDYAFTTTDALNNISYTTEGMTLVEHIGSLSMGTPSATTSLSAGTIYFKSSNAATITIAPQSYTYTVGSATVDYEYVQGGETVTITYANAASNDPNASFAKNGNPTITFGGSAVAITPTSNGFTFTAPTVTPGTSYTLSIPANAFGYAANGTYNAAQEITIKVPAIFDGTYFFKDDNDKFWLRGEPYGSAVQVYDWGMPVNITTDALGATTLHFADASDWKIFSDGTGIYADNASHANSTWSIIKSGTKYIFKNAVNNHFMKVDGTRILSTVTEEEATAFTLVTPAEHQAVLTAYVNAQASAAATAASLSASTPAELQTAANGIYATTIIEGSTAATTAEKWQGGQWDSRTIYSNTINVTTPGLYKFTIQAFYRMTDNVTTYALHTAQADCPPVYVFFGDAKTPIKSVMDESRATAYEGNNCDYANGVNHYPNQQASSLVAFKEGKYTNTVWVYIAEAGDYSYGIQYLGWAGSHSEWTCYTTESISLTYYYTGSLDYVKDGIHYYKGAFDTAPAIELTDAVPVADVTDATFSGTSSVTFTNPNGLVFAKAASQVNNTTNVVVNGACTTLVLADGHPFVNPTAFTATNASYTLSALAGGSFATLLIPFAATLPSGGTAYALDQSVDLLDGNIRGTAVSSVAANTPVLVTKAGDYTATNAAIPAIASGATYPNGELVGTYSAVAAPTSSYVLQNHTNGEGVAFYLVGSTKPQVGPFRAYIKPQDSNVKAISVMFDEDGIQTMDNGQWTMDNAEIFNLSGQRLSKPQRGVNIINGKKVVVK